MPTMAEGLLRAYKIMQQVGSFEDVECLFLMGAGLSRNTYRAYLQSVKNFYGYTEGLNPLQVRPADIEAYYDELVDRDVNDKTIALRIAGLKKFFSGIRNVIPAYTSPFEVMSDKLKKKLGKREKDKGTKQALNKEEIRRTLKHLRENEDPVDHAMIFFLLTSGLRAAEMLSLRWEDFDLNDGAWTAWFVAKGGKRTEHEIYGPAVEAARASYQRVFRRDPKPDDKLFWIPANGDIARPMSYATLWHRCMRIGERLRAAGLIRKSLQFTPHLFRRSYITGLYRSGMKLKALQKKSRHRSTEILINHYIDDSEAATPYLDKIFTDIEERTV